MKNSWTPLPPKSQMIHSNNDFTVLTVENVYLSPKYNLRLGTLTPTYETNNLMILNFLFFFLVNINLEKPSPAYYGRKESFVALKERSSEVQGVVRMLRLE